MNGQRHLRLVPPAPPRRPRYVEVRIVVSSARMPIGRSRVFRLAHDEFDELIDAAILLESRR